MHGHPAVVSRTAVVWVADRQGAPFGTLSERPNTTGPAVRLGHPPKMLERGFESVCNAVVFQVVTHLGPRKPQRNPSIPVSWAESDKCQLLSVGSPKRLCLETSFTSLHSPSIEVASSISDGTNGGRGGSPVQLTSVLAILDEKLRGGSGAVLAPLASPEESLSEASSVAELRTPKILRRTLKVPGNLSTCADDIENVRCFQRLRVSANALASVSASVSTTATTSSGDLSYESATSVGPERCCSAGQEQEQVGSLDTDSFRSAENALEAVAAVRRTTVYMETHFDEEPVTTPVPSRCVPISPTVEEDPDVVSNLAIDLQLEEENRSVQSRRPASSVDSGSACRTPVSEGRVVTFSPQVVNIVPGSRNSSRSSGSSSPSRAWPWRRPKPTNESLPLLSGLQQERTSPNFVRRKKYVYPMTCVGRGESSV